MEILSLAWFSTETITSNITVYTIVFLFFLWILVILWVAKDSAARYRSFWAQLFALMLVVVLTPLVWLPLYLVIRPLFYLKRDDQYYDRGDIMRAVDCCCCCEAKNVKKKKSNKTDKKDKIDKKERIIKKMEEMRDFRKEK